uniref:hypothetical protein n=1 Tax=Corynebacterium testudinoris TaxID=136857 RepID=UPI0038B31FFF
MDRVRVLHRLRIIHLRQVREGLALSVCTVVLRAGRAQLSCDVLVAELPVPLECGHVDRHLRILIQGHNLVLSLNGEEEQHHDDEDRHDGQHQLKRNVVLQLLRELALALLLSLLSAPAENGHQHENPHDDANDPGGSPDPDPEVVHGGSFRGDTRRPAHA